MCMYCERRKDVRFGWLQPELPVSGNIADGTTVTVHDYRTAQPEIAIRNDRIMDRGFATLTIPANFCPVCGRTLGTKRFRTFERHRARKGRCPNPVNTSAILKTCLKRTYDKIQMRRGKDGEPADAILRKSNGEHPVYINTVPHTVSSLKELIHVRNMPDGSIMRKYADLTARILMSIDPNMLFMVRRVISDMTPEEPPLIPRTDFDLYVDASDLQNMDQNEQFRYLAKKTLEAVRRYALQSPFLKDCGYGPELSSDEAIRAWASEQMENVTWRDPALTTWT